MKFRIAGHTIAISFHEGQSNSIALLPSFRPFLVGENEEEAEREMLFSLMVDDTLRPRPKAERERIRIFDTGNGNTVVDKLADGGYQYIIRNTDQSDCCLLITNSDFSHCQCALNGTYNMRSFGLNNALMLVYAFAGSRAETLLIHASLVRYQGRGYAFTAKSGTGKSTHVSMWLRYLPHCDLMNDDNPIIRFIEGQPYIYGSPWSGKTPCYRNIQAPLGAITQINRAPQNSVCRLQPLQAFATLIPACSAMKWDETLYSNICDTISRLVETTPIYDLFCLPNEEAAIVCHKAIAT